MTNIIDLGKNNNGPRQIEVNPAGLEPVKCKECDGIHFQVAIIFIRMPAGHPDNPTKTAQEAMSQTFVCINCGADKNNEATT